MWVRESWVLFDIEIELTLIAPLQSLASAPHFYEMELTKKQKVFVSCVEYEFEHELKAVERMLRDSGFEIIGRKTGIGGAIGMFFDLERDYVRRCDVFIGMYGSAYGGFSNRPDENYIEIGYRTAEDLGRPVLAFVQNVRVREERLHALVSRIVTRQGGITFDSERELLQRLSEIANETRVLKPNEIRAQLPEPKILAKDATSPRDVFICHASEDNPSVAEPLTQALDKGGISYWYDQAEIKWGDSVTRKVNEGLKISRYVIVVLSKSFIGKHWPNRELSAALNIEASTGETRVLPLIVGSEIERIEILAEFPLLNDKRYVVWAATPTAIVDALTSRLAGSS